GAADSIFCFQWRKTSAPTRPLLLNHIIIGLSITKTTNWSVSSQKNEKICKLCQNRASQSFVCILTFLIPFAFHQKDAEHCGNHQKTQIFCRNIRAHILVVLSARYQFLPKREPAVL